MQLLPDGSYTIEDTVSIDGEGISPFVFCRGWLLEIVEIESGVFSFVCDSEKVEPGGPRFGVFYPPFSFVRSYVKDFRGTVNGVGQIGLLPGLPTSPVLFETDSHGPFTSAADAIDVLGWAKNVRPISVSSKPSLLSIRTKRLIDDNYLMSPSISRIADRLKVSHAHLTRQFRRDFEMTPSEYLHHLRVAEATFRLSIGEEIVDISEDVGYNDLSRFYKQFRKKTRTSPANCREMLRSERR
jgi:AraC-like DNA-binding protein